MNIGFQSFEFVTKENSSAVATVCAQIDRGSLERDVVAYLTTTALIGDTAMGMYTCSINRLHPYTRLQQLLYNISGKGPTDQIMIPIACSKYYEGSP